MGNTAKTLLSRRAPEEVLVADEHASWVSSYCEFSMTDVDHGDIEGFRAAVEAFR